MIFAPNVRDVHGWLRELHVHIFHRLDNDFRNSKVPEPFVIRRNDEPRSVFSAGLVKHILERLRVVIPESAFLVVGVTDLPLTRRVIQPLLESGKLFLFRDVQKKFENCRAVLRGDQLFEIVDFIVPF